MFMAVDAIKRCFYVPPPFWLQGAHSLSWQLVTVLPSSSLAASLTSTVTTGLALSFSKTVASDPDSVRQIKAKQVPVVIEAYSHV